MQNPRNWLNMALNVAKARASHTGHAIPAQMPSIMAMMIFGNKPMRFHQGLSFVGADAVIVDCWLWPTVLFFRKVFSANVAIALHKSKHYRENR